MTRDEAEKQYVIYIMTEGNPEYFVWKHLRNISNDQLAEEWAAIFDGDELEIEEEK